MEQRLTLQSPVGTLTLAANEHAVTRLTFGDATDARDDRDSGAAFEVCTLGTATALLRQAAYELEEYFAGTRRMFTFPLAPAGTPFQQRVWEALRAIPYGQTRTYAQIAAAAGNPRASRAAGMANHRNPIAIVIPCHRVIGAGGALTGYAGGLEKKSFLLGLEQEARVEK